MWRDGTNVFAGKGDALGLSPLAYNFVGGLLAHAEALCALTNPVVNSYKRINAPPTVSGATWSPSTISWGGNNRTHMIRVPGPGRVEYRLADGAANPYLLQAGLLAAGLDGITRALDPGAPVDRNMYVDPTGARRLPLNLLDAIRAFTASTTLADSLGQPFASAYAKLKLVEWDAYMRHLTQWERDTTLDC
jgi:glutamine synthetase